MGGTEDQRLGLGCPACHVKIPHYLGRKGGFEILSCEGCGTIYSSSGSDSQTQNYDGYYTSENLSVPDFIHRRLDEIVAGFSSYRVYNRALEVGFGAGSLLSAAIRAGWDAEGVEVSESAVKHGESLGFKAFHGELAEARFEEGSFDLVIASELLEHVPDPAGIICEIARILRSGGLFWGTTPNARGLSSRLLGLEWSVNSPPEHLHLLSEKGIRTLCAEAGFRKVNIDTEGTNPFELVRLRGRSRKNGSLPTDVPRPVSGCDRVNAGYQLNETLMRSGPRRTVKNILNSLLRVSHLGDSLKISAER